MPREIIKKDKDGFIVVSWGDKFCQLEIGLSKPVSIGDEQFDSIFATLSERSDFTKIIKALKRARSKIAP